MARFDELTDYAEECRAALQSLEQAYSNPHSPQHRAACLAEARTVLDRRHEIGQRPKASELIEPLSAEASEAWEGLMATADAVTPPALSREYAVVPGFPNIREWCRGSPTSIVITFVDDITSEQMAAIPKALMDALYRRHSQVSLRDWTEDASHENGRYECGPCVECGHTFVGHKRRVICRGCANPVPAQCNGDGVKR